MESLAHGAIRFWHLGDLREHGAFPVHPVRARVRPLLIESCFFLFFS
jgi:hypothetical protein